MLSKLVNNNTILRNYIYRHVRRFLSSNVHPISGRPAATRQLVVPAKEKGFFSYERNVSRDKKFDNPQLKGDTPLRFMFRRLGHAYEVYPLFFLCGSWFCAFVVVSCWSFLKIEVWVDRSQETAPWSWDKIRNNYWKSKKALFDIEGKLDKRLEIMEVLQDEMMEAAKKRASK
uniref:Uncharacterized protein n=1 Tax=Parastrongyloides trichosuri TaxID=131310 RepID=A0A0N4ZX76_PARTI